MECTSNMPRLSQCLTFIPLRAMPTLRNKNKFLKESQFTAVL